MSALGCACPGAWQHGKISTWLGSLELLLCCEQEGPVLGTAPLCLYPCGSETVHLGGTSRSSLEPIRSPNLLLKMEAKLWGRRI